MRRVFSPRAILRRQVDRRVRWVLSSPIRLLRWLARAFVRTLFLNAALLTLYAYYVFPDRFLVAVDGGIDVVAVLTLVAGVPNLLPVAGVVTVFAVLFPYFETGDGYDYD